MILSEANQWPEDVRPYFGEGDEVHMNFHFPLMPRMFMALKRGDFTPVKEILARTPEIPANCQWCTFLRNHDELTLEMVTEEERQWMWQQYAPDPRMKLNLGIRRRLAPLLDYDHRKIMLANSLLLTLPGSPVIYYGDEIGMGDNIWLRDRDGVRTPMQWDNSTNAGFSAASKEQLYYPVIEDEKTGYKQVNVAGQAIDPNSLLSKFKNMLAKRKLHLGFGRGAFRWVEELDQPEIATFWREFKDERLLVIHNISADPVEVDLSGIIDGNGSVWSILTDEKIAVGLLALAPFEFVWLQV